MYPYSLSNNPGYVSEDPDFIRERFDREEMEDDADVLRAEQDKEDAEEEND